eukprot:Em0004g1002a
MPRLRIEQVSGNVESPAEGSSIEISTSDDRAQHSSNDSKDSDDDEEPSVLQALSSEQLARRPSFKRILEDLSSADPALKNCSDPLALSAAATLQAQQALLQQASLTNPSLIPGLLHGLQQNLTATSSGSGDLHIPHLSMMMPSHHQLQLQSALLNASAAHAQSLAASQSPLIAGAVSLAGQTNAMQLPASLLSSALLNAASLSSNSAASGGNTNISGSQLKNGQSSPGNHPMEDTSHKREVRLMKNREAARECRRKKKEYVRCLENRVAVLESQNQALIGELRALKELYLPKSQD